jgi:hypothetical protein
LFFSLLGETFFPCIRPPVFDRDRAAFDPAKFAQSPHKICDEGAPGCSRGSAQQSDGRHFPRLLRARRERPRHRRAADERDGLATFQLM